MKKIQFFCLLLVTTFFGFSQNSVAEYYKLNHALRGLSLIKFPSAEVNETSRVLNLIVVNGVVDKVQFSGEKLYPASTSKCLCTEIEIKEEINKMKIKWELLLNQMNCDTSYAVLPIIFRNETKVQSVPRGATLYRDCIELLFQDRSSIGGCYVLLKPLLIILKDVIDN